MGLIVRNKKFYGNNPLQQLVNYSTDEQVIGKWIDGKPLYEKTIDFGGMPNNTTKTVAHNISNVSRFVDVRGCYKSVGGVAYPLPQYVGTYYYALYADSTNVTIVDNISLGTGTTTYVTLRYAKTRD